MAQGRKASQVQTKINLVAWGAPFSGKSTLGMQLSLLKTPEGRPFRLLVLDAEQGGCDDMIYDLEEKGANKDNIYIVYTQSLEEVNLYIKRATAHEDLPELDEVDGHELDSIVLDADGQPFHPDAILVDGSSVLKLTCQQSLLNLTKRRAKLKANKNGLMGDERTLAIDDAQLSPREWGALGYSGQSLVLNLAASGLHWVMTCREKDETEQKIVNGQQTSINTGKKIPDSFKAIGYNAKTVCHMYRDDDEFGMVKMYVEKDRTHTFPECQAVDNPSLLSFQPMIDKTRHNTNVNVRNTMEQAVDIESKMYQKSLGIEDEPVEQPTPASPQASTSIDYKASIKKFISLMKPDQKAEFKKALTDSSISSKSSEWKDEATFKRIYELADKIMSA